jgi:hypothetical protein
MLRCLRSTTGSSACTTAWTLDRADQSLILHTQGCARSSRCSHQLGCAMREQQASDAGARFAFRAPQTLGSCSQPYPRPASCQRPSGQRSGYREWSDARSSARPRRRQVDHASRRGGRIRAVVRTTQAHARDLRNCANRDRLTILRPHRKASRRSTPTVVAIRSRPRRRERFTTNLHHVGNGLAIVDRYDWRTLACAPRRAAMNRRLDGLCSRLPFHAGKHPRGRRAGMQ